MTTNSSSDTQGKARLLLADDDRLILATLGTGLRKAGYHVTGIGSGEEAVASLGQESFDLAILDIRMQGLSGIDAARSLRDQHDLYTLFLSAYSDEETVVSAVNEGAVGYVVKPVTVQQLVPAVEAALARVRDLRALRKAREQLEASLAGSRAISVAVGLLMERERLDHDTAFQILRSEARSQSRRLVGLAEEVIAATETMNRFDSARR